MACLSSTLPAHADEHLLLTPVFSQPASFPSLAPCDVEDVLCLHTLVLKLDMRLETTLQDLQSTVEALAVADATSAVLRKEVQALGQTVGDLRKALSEANLGPPWYKHWGLWLAIGAFVGAAATCGVVYLVSRLTLGPI